MDADETRQAPTPCAAVRVDGAKVSWSWPSAVGQGDDARALVRPASAVPSVFSLELTLTAYQYSKIEAIRIQAESTEGLPFFNTYELFEDLAANQEVHCRGRQTYAYLPVHQLPSELTVPESENDAILQNSEDNLYILPICTYSTARFSKKRLFHDLD